MPSIVIVTKQCYLLAEAINYITINEVRDDDYVKLDFDNSKKKSKKPTKKGTPDDARQFQIIVDFIPLQGTTTTLKSNHNSSGSVNVAVAVTGRERTLDLFAHMVDQIREQLPDQKFLDQMVEKFLTETKDEHQN